MAEVFGVRAAVIAPLTGDPLIAFDHRAPTDTEPAEAVETHTDV